MGSSSRILLVLGLLWAASSTLVQAADVRLFERPADRSLQALLDNRLRHLGLSRAVRDGHLAVAVVDLANPDRPRVASANGDRMMYAASLPKIGILLAALYEVERGRFTFDDSLRRSLNAMIRVSSNEEATRVMNLVGKRRVNRILASPRFRFYDFATNGGLWVGKEYGPRPAFERDPLHHISHGATALQVARFYYLLETNQLLRPDLNREMLRILGRPGIAHKFVKGLAGRDVDIYRKSGTWRQWHADSALIKSPLGTYILVGMVQDSRGGEWLARLARSVHDGLVMSRTVARVDR